MKVSVTTQPFQTREQVLTLNITRDVVKIIINLFLY